MLFFLTFADSGHCSPFAVDSTAPVSAAFSLLCAGVFEGRTPFLEWNTNVGVPRMLAGGVAFTFLQASVVFVIREHGALFFALSVGCLRPQHSFRAYTDFFRADAN